MAHGNRVLVSLVVALAIAGWIVTSVIQAPKYRGNEPPQGSERSAEAAQLTVTPGSAVALAIGDGKCRVHCAFSSCGTRTATIDAVKTGCGCTNAELSSRVIGPGETANLDFQVDASAAPA